MWFYLLNYKIVYGIAFSKKKAVQLKYEKQE